MYGAVVVQSASVHWPEGRTLKQSSATPPFGAVAAKCAYALAVPVELPDQSGVVSSHIQFPSESKSTAPAQYAPTPAVVARVRNAWYSVASLIVASAIPARPH